MKKIEPNKRQKISKKSFAISSKSQNKEFLISLLLRSGIAIVFIYAAISSFLNPTSWIGFVPGFIELVIPGGIFLIIFSVYEIILGFGLLADYKTFSLSIISSITLFFILFGNILALDILFRDIAILFMSLALVALSSRKWRQNS